MKLKVISYNIQAGRTAKNDFYMLGLDIAAEGADLIGIQEVDINLKRSEYRNTIKEIAEAAGYSHYYFCHAIYWENGEYGTVLMSKYPIKSFRAVFLESHGDEQRAAGIAEIEIGGKEITFINTHLSLGDAEARREQFEALAELVRGKTYVMTGDFNTEDLSEFEPIGAATIANTPERKLCSYQQYGIDNILTSGEFTLLSTFIRNDVVHSDHSMIGAEYEMK